MDIYQFNHGINQCTNVSKLSAGWLIRNILMENKEKFFFFGFLFHLILWSS